MTHRRVIAPAKAASLALSLLVLTGAASALASDARPRVEVSPSVHHDSTPPLWLMPRALAPEEDADEEAFEAKFDHKLRKVPKRPAPAGLNRPDPVRQSYRPYPAMPAVMATFDGVGQGFTGPQGSYSVRSVPPDTTGDVGPNHYVQTVNTGFAIFDKSGRVLYGPANTNTVWAGFGGQCAGTNRGDAVVLYDQLVDRWFITQFAFDLSGGEPVAPFLQCVAVSQSGDPTGAWHRYSFQYSLFPDYGKFSVWPDAYYATFMGFNGTTFSFAGSIVCAYDRNKMLLGEPATQQCVTLPAFGGLLPADLEGSRLPPAGTPNYVMGFESSPSVLQLWKFTVDWNNPANTSLVKQPDLAVASMTQACTNSCVTQPGTGTRLDAIGDRLMFRLGYRNHGTHESLVLNHTVATSSTAGAPLGVRWYEVRSPATGGTVHQQGTYAPADGNHRWMGSIAQDQLGNLALGFSISGSALNPGISYTGRLATDPLGQLPQGENSIIAGGGVQTSTQGVVDRWGDYSNMSVDPTDDCTFWYTTEYLPSTGAFNWRTRIGSFKFPGCPATVANDFSLAVSPRSRTIAAGGGSAAYTVTTAVASGTAETIVLSVTNLPPGVTAVFSPASVTAGGTATLTVTSVAGAPRADNVAFNVVGTSASATRLQVANLTVQGNDFTLALTPSNRVISAGGTGTYTVSTTATTGTAELVTFSASGLPQGVTASFNPASVTAGGSSTLTLTVSASAPLTRNAQFTVTGTAPSAAHSVQATVTIPNDFSLTLNPTKVVVTNGGRINVTITTARVSGTAELINLTVSGVPAGVGTTLLPSVVTAGGTATLTLESSASTPPVVDATYTVTGTSPTVTKTAQGTLSALARPTVTLTSPTPGKVRGTAVTVAATGTVSQGTALDRIELYVGDTLLATGSGLPFSTLWNTTRTPNGNHLVNARLYDQAGSVAISNTSVLVRNVAPPTVSITVPTAGEVVKGEKYLLRAAVQANDGASIVRTEFLVDDVLVGTNTITPPQLEWNTSKVKDGPHVLVAKTYDSEEQVTSSTEVAFTVKNGCGCSSDGGAAGTGGLLALLVALRRLGARRRKAA